MPLLRPGLLLVTALLTVACGDADDGDTSGPTPAEEIVLANSSSSSSSSSSGDCSVDDRVECVEAFNACDDRCDTIDCVCTCGRAEHQCFREIGCTQEYADTTSHASICQ